MDQKNQLNTMSPSLNGGERKKVGPIVATLIIVLVLIVAALYLLASKINQQSTPVPDFNTNNTVSQANASATETATIAQPTVPQITNTATDVQSLQNDLNASTQGIDGQSF